MKLVNDAYWMRQGIKSVVWLMLPIALIGGWLYPPLGLGVLICMFASIGISFTKGRAWCDYCPRGTFFDTVMARFSRGRSVPRFLRSTPFRILVLVFLMTMMTVQLVHVWGDIGAMGRVFWLLLAVTTAIGIILAIPIHPRTWCSFCPMGSAASWIGRRKQPLQVDATKCTGCGACSLVCPMELNPGACREESVMVHGDCLKCRRCIVQCPRSALSFDASSPSTCDPPSEDPAGVA